MNYRSAFWKPYMMQCARHAVQDLPLEKCEREFGEVFLNSASSAATLLDYTPSSPEDQGCKSEPCSFDNTEINMSPARQVCQEIMSPASLQPKGSQMSLRLGPWHVQSLKLCTSFSASEIKDAGRSGFVAFCRMISSFHRETPGPVMALMSRATCTVNIRLAHMARVPAWRPHYFLIKYPSTLFILSCALDCLMSICEAESKVFLDVSSTWGLGPTIPVR